MDTSKNAALLLQQELEAAKRQVASLQEEKQALQQEFSNEKDFEEAKNLTKRELKDALLPDSLAQAKFLLNSAESESVRAGLAKFFITLVLSPKIEGNADDTFKQMLKDFGVKSQESN